MKYLLDTNTCVAYLRGKDRAIRERMDGHQPADLVVCSIVLGELVYGAHRSADPNRNLALLERYFHPFARLPFDELSVDAYGRLRAKLENAGTPIGANDYLIAAIALAHSLCVVTHNVREFARVDGLTVEDWTG